MNSSKNITSKHNPFRGSPLDKGLFPALAGLILVTMILNACGEYSRSGAAQGAATGAAASALGTLVVGLVFNDPNLAERVGRSAVYGATVGAAAGGIAGAAHDERIRQTAEKREAQAAAERAKAAQSQESMSDAEVLKAIGRKNFEALTALSDCRFDEAVKRARESEASFNPKYREASLWIQAVAAVENRDNTTLDRIYTELVKLDPELGQPEKADAALAEALQAMAEDRKAQGRPPKCD